LERSLLSPAVFEILGSKRIGGHEFDLSGSRDVIGNVTILLPNAHNAISYWWSVGPSLYL